MNDDISNHNDRKPKLKTWTKEDNNLHYTTILEATLPKEGIGKQWERSGKNLLFFRLQAKGLTIKFEQ